MLKIYQIAINLRPSGGFILFYCS